MAIVWHTNMTASELVVAGPDLDVPRPSCPECVTAMSFWGSYERAVRGAGTDVRIRVRRAMCKFCRRSHAVLPDLAAVGRLDSVDVIGTAMTDIAAGETAGSVASKINLPYTTVRDWRRRFVKRAGLLAAGFLRAVVALGDLVPNLPELKMPLAVVAVAAAASTVRRRFGLAGADWRLANLVCGGHLLTTNTDPPWIAA